MRWRPQIGPLIGPAILAVAVSILGSLHGNAARITNASAAVDPAALVTSDTAARGSSWKPLPAVAAAVGERHTARGRSIHRSRS
jgi:hypothetical protein